ncbi:MAG: winged helix-turn-helix domain-containing protein [Anaerolineaceae bacterium]
MLQNNSTKLNWDIGTGYDLFISLIALHNPESYGLRASWAAGVRSRLPVEDRQTLETVYLLMFSPLHLVHGLPKPKSAATVLQKLASIPESKRLEAVSLQPNTPDSVSGILQGSISRKKWTSAEKNVLAEAYHIEGRSVTPTQLELLYQTWTHREKFGHDYLKALTAYVESFFLEEEQRILPVLKQGLSHAQMRAGSLPLPAMLEELSSGVRFEELANISKIYLAPSFWGTPFLFYQHLDNDTMLMLYGARPDNMALTPGEVVPDSLLRGLKALADPTRLRILRSLAQTPQTAAQLSRALRLRPPTVAHHLMELRMAGMVQITITTEGERHYATRYEGFDTNQDLLNRFVHGE